jgi:hypothetical protein
MSILPHQCGCVCHNGGHCSGNCCDNVGSEPYFERGDEDICTVKGHSADQDVLVSDIQKQLGKLQVELAKLSYRLECLVHSGRLPPNFLEGDTNPADELANMGYRVM